MAVAALLLAQRQATIPAEPPVAMAVAPNYEVFTPDAPALAQPVTGQLPITGSPQAPGAARFDGPATYTPAGSGGLTNVLGGEPPLATNYRLHRSPGAYTHANAPTIQLRLGVGQQGPSSLGVAQTIEQATLLKNPPTPANDLLRIVSGQ